ncbi:MAG: ATP-binding protein [Jaaginema sp. PMC 1079.18]|nr:ATP-binding protein [Jaaginema sp. PMC 1080.18]MEC4850085.1 ATP-binding protein [Jaaginema sp. PMC 1079.18]MEC4867566.1 ATP-binding protein [Jaaginema sp. PMC 1078.18]
MEYLKSDISQYEAKIKALEKENNFLKRKLKRSQEQQAFLEETNEKKESLLQTVIQELQQSQKSLEKRKQIIENLKNTQAKLVQTEKMSSLGQLVAGIAHEINNPVNFIHGNLKYIENCLTDLLKVVHFCRQKSVDLAVIVDEIELDFIIDDLPKVIQSMTLGTSRISDIVRSLRNFSRLDESEFKQVDIHEGIDNSLLILSYRLKQENIPAIEIIKKYGDLPGIDCCPGQINQVFMNLLTNAIDACEAAYQQGLERDYQIIIQTQYYSPQRVTITVQDNGIGIPDSIVSKLFDPFYTTKPIGKGTGLGLAISYQVVAEKHNGTLDCQSIEGQGTTFTIDIPIHGKTPYSSLKEDYISLSSGQ